MIVEPQLFDQLTCLRTLHLKGRSILELPNEVEKLIHLRLLKLSCEEIKELPESICNLCNLQSLDVSECWELDKLPQRIGKLINLRHLLFIEDVEETRIKSFPKGIGRLTCLKTLRYFPVGGKGEEICKLGELEHLNHIQGTLFISGLKNVIDFGAIENTLKKKNHLRDLRLLHTHLHHSSPRRRQREWRLWLGSARNAKIKTENLSSYATVKIENSDGMKDGGAKGTGPAGPTAPTRGLVPGIVVKEDATKIFTENIQTSGPYSARDNE
ncbi:putative disease resistance protein rga4 [Quercus suber]|uniref:Disease resistance protein rga4 n=1 Tax=Quercus suber TaxID=58331 RepID=A0AAW0KQ76_QUESU